MTPPSSDYTMQMVGCAVPGCLPHTPFKAGNKSITTADTSPLGNAMHFPKKVVLCVWFDLFFLVWEFVISPLVATPEK